MTKLRINFLYTFVFYTFVCVSMSEAVYLVLWKNEYICIFSEFTDYL